MGITTARLQREVEIGVEEVASRLQRCKNWLINQAIGKFVAMQDLEQAKWRETLAALESVAQGKAVPCESVHAWLRSWGQPDELSPPAASQ